ncbi:hypothetical protein A0J61_11736 [Choanephora cucurbitarum]|uniref:Uncharacterized protein n=1 Tax=Choanephora cucurbitarum TaxID=101091 RepID=A0A1C7MTL7_9FUNG|nr:hypothetical protein A0J61_11736 [Choanephora cucurbitarum]
MASERPQPTRNQRRKQVAHHLEVSPVQEPARGNQDIDSDVESVLVDWDPIDFDAQDFDDIMSVPEQAESAKPMNVDDHRNDIVKEKMFRINH